MEKIFITYINVKEALVRLYEEFSFNSTRNNLDPSVEKTWADEQRLLKRRISKWPTH